MRFEEFTYERPDMEALEKAFKEKIVRFSAAANAEIQHQILAEINALRVEFDTQFNICHIRHTANTHDDFYEAENNFFDQESPHFRGWVNDFYSALLDSPFRADLEQKWGKQLFHIADLTLKTQNKSVIALLQEENRLSSEYTRTKAKAQIEFMGETHNLASIEKFGVSPDRKLRKAAIEAKWGFYRDKEAVMDQLFDDLVQVRHQIATALGFNNFVELGYARMLRSDYGPDEVAVFRKGIAAHITPLATQFYEQQAQALGLDTLKYYDEDLRFPRGNPQPKGDPAWIIRQAAHMYRELAPETHEFFEFMQTHHLMDLQTRQGKAMGGYCTYIAKHKAPFIFSNFNGTSADIDVLTHEAGHAFQVYSSRNIGISEYQWPTYEACEIHSMSMEFFAWPWMDAFFKEDADLYRFSHLNNAVYFLPYGSAVDEFQHFVYSHPTASPAERKSFWRQLELKYLPHRDYDGFDFLEGGGYWHKQTHIFAMPFYYIDYVLAQICAFQFWKKDQEEHQQAWADYLRLCQAGGSHSFLNLLKLANLKSPFDADCIEEVSRPIANWLESWRLETV